MLFRVTATGSLRLTGSGYAQEHHGNGTRSVALINISGDIASRKRYLAVLPSRVKMGNLASDPATRSEAPMAKKAAKPKSTEEPAAEGTESTSSHGKAMSKAEAIRTMMAEGIDNPSAASAEIKKRFGLDVTPQHFSAARSQMKSKAGTKKGKPGRKPRQAAEAAESRPAAPQASPAGGDMIDDLAAVKHLVQKLGADQVRKIVGLFE